MDTINFLLQIVRDLFLIAFIVSSAAALGTIVGVLIPRLRGEIKFVNQITKEKK